MSPNEQGETERRAPGPLKVLTARLVLFWEDLWPGLVPVLAPIFFC